MNLVKLAFSLKESHWNKLGTLVISLPIIIKIIIIHVNQRKQKIKYFM